MDLVKPITINIWAPPGVGKSMTRAAVFLALKAAFKAVEEVHEVAKLLTYEGNRSGLSCQFYVTAVQEYRQNVLRRHVRYIVTDCPVGLSLLWAEAADYKAVLAMCRHLRERYVNIDVRLIRKPDVPFERHGRFQTPEQSEAMEAPLTRILGDLEAQPLFVTTGDTHTIVKHATKFELEGGYVG